MSILPPVFTNAGQVAFNIAGVVRGFVEGWGKQQNKTLIPFDQPLHDGSHRLSGPLPGGGLRQHGPRLGNGVNLAFPVLARTERCPIIVVGPPVPASIPGLGFQSVAQFDGPLAIRGGWLQALKALAELGKILQGSVEKPTQPDTFAFPLAAHPIDSCHRSNHRRPSGANRAALWCRPA